MVFPTSRLTYNQTSNNLAHHRSFHSRPACLVCPGHRAGSTIWDRVRYLPSLRYEGLGQLALAILQLLVRATIQSHGQSRSVHVISPDGQRNTPTTNYLSAMDKSAHLQLRLFIAPLYNSASLIQIRNFIPLLYNSVSLFRPFISPLYNYASLICPFYSRSAVLFRPFTTLPL